MIARRIAALALLGLLLTEAAEKPGDLARRTFDAVNQERARRGLGRLKWDDDIAALARAHSGRMRDRDFFSHDDPERGDLTARIVRTPIPWSTVAENLYAEHGYPNPVQQAVKSWLDSPGHRRNMLGRGFTRTGVGVATNGQGRYWFTQIFVGGGKP